MVAPFKENRPVSLGAPLLRRCAGHAVVPVVKEDAFKMLKGRADCGIANFSYKAQVT